MNSSNNRDGYSLTISPRMTQYWTPHCEDEIKPLVGKIFKSLEAAIEFYKNYASRVGFDIRLSSVTRASDGVILIRHVVCSKEGFNNVLSQNCPSRSNADAQEGSSKPKRRTISTRTGCKAKIVFKFIGSHGYVVKLFEEKHNHCMSSVLAKQFLKVNRNLNPAHQKFIANCARANIRPTKCFNLYKETVGDFSGIGATSVDFKNFKRDIKAFILGADGQMIVHNLFQKKKELYPAFAFDYDVDENEQLCRIFWADPISKKNYAAFGDVVSFYATYQTNRYNMVFTPFTGVDNHKKCITFGAGLLLKEDKDSYIWLFENFKKAMGTEPKVIVTDEDPAMKVAIPRVFQQARHRYCMWHIMSKVGDKVGPTLSKNDDFKKKLNSIVWSSYLEPVDFEKQWKLILEEFDLVNRNRFIKMYESKRFWIPAYFRDVCMGGLLRTTSRSESQNNMFSYFTSPQFSLVEFLMNFESALALQRYNNAKNNSDNEGSIPQFKTPLALEKHASSVYTLTIFYEIQAEICSSCFTCRVLKVREDAEIDGVIFEIDGVIFYQCGAKDEKKVLLNKLWADVHCCINLAKTNMEQLTTFSEMINEQKQLLISGKEKLSHKHRRQAVIESFCGSTELYEISILPPKQAKNKGSGKRIKGSKEMTLDTSKKNKRLCRNCNVFAYHDSRNCPLGRDD